MAKIEGNRVIVGMGFAGLEAALQSSEAQNLILYESSFQPGGRTQLSGITGCPLPDKAASFVHGPRLHDLARQAGVEVLPLDNLSFWVSDKGRLQQVEMEEGPFAVMEALKEPLLEAQRNAPIAQILGENQSFRNQFDPLNYEVALRLLEADVGASLEIVGATSALDGTTADDAASGSVGVVLKGGIGQIAKYMHTAVFNRFGKDSFHFLRELKSIENANGALRLHFVDRTNPTGDKGRHIVEAATAFITVPVNRLQEIVTASSSGNNETRGLTTDIVEPDVKRALSMLGMGAVTKIAFEVSQPIVAADSLPAHVSVNDPSCSSVWVFPKDGAQIVLMYLGGPPAIEAATMGKEQLTGWIRKYLSRNFSLDCSPRWHISPWVSGSKGAYSFVRADNSEDGFRPREALMKPQCNGRLFLGGEACTNELPGFVAGALASASNFKP